MLHKDHIYHHAERPERIEVIYKNLSEKKLWSRLKMIKSEIITDEVLMLVHTKEHIQNIKNTIYHDEKKNE